MGGLVCFDTNICIWGFNGQCSGNQEDNVVKAKFLIDYLSNINIDIVVPAVVLAELLARVGRSEQIAFAARMNADPFDVRPFDTLAAVEYARLAAKLPEETREKSKVDRMIVATALAVKAEAIYSHDPHIKIIANQFIEVRLLPTPPPHQLLLPTLKK